MTFLLIGRDGSDAGAPERRRRAREAHLKLGDELKARGELLYAAAILDEDGNMSGSMLVLDFPSQAELARWLRIEPYATGGVWKDVRIERCRPGPAFAKT